MIDQAKIIEFVKTRKELSLFVGFALISLMVMGLNHESKAEKPLAAAPRESFDTLIPAGYSLVPLEIANYETLDSLLGSFGVVDIFTAPQDPTQKAERIAYRVKIIRAPRNPSHFAVLVPFEKVKNILRHPGPFMVSVQNPKEVGTGFEEQRKRKSRILYNLGE